jgi:hypothetical protein
MGPFQRWNPAPWKPTAEQEQAAIRLSDPLIGARGRSLIDGNVELRTLKQGEIRRYVIYPDGTTTLIESRAASTHYKRVELFRTVAGLFAIALIIWLIVAQAIDFHEELLGWVAGAIFVSFMSLFVTEIIMNREVEPPGEQWQRVGGSD